LAKHPEEGIAKGSRNMLNGLLGRISLVWILCSGNTMTEEVRELVETPRRRNCERKSKHVKRFVRTG